MQMASLGMGSISGGTGALNSSLRPSCNVMLRIFPHLSDGFGEMKWPPTLCAVGVIVQVIISLTFKSSQVLNLARAFN